MHEVKYQMLERFRLFPSYDSIDLTEFGVVYRCTELI